MKKISNKTEQITSNDGEWYLIKEGWFTHECCDCGLQHKVELKIVKDKIAISFTSIKSETELMIEAGFPICFPKNESSGNAQHCKTCIKNYNKSLVRETISKENI